MKSLDDMPARKFTISEFASYYIEAINAAPNAWGQQIHPKTKTESGRIMMRGRMIYGDRFLAEIKKQMQN